MRRLVPRLALVVLLAGGCGCSGRSEAPGLRQEPVEQADQGTPGPADGVRTKIKMH